MGGRRPGVAEAGLWISAKVFENNRRWATWSGSLIAPMSAFEQLFQRLPALEPTPPVWRMRCRCPAKAGPPGQIAACGCRFWWRIGKRGGWYAISRRRAFRALLPELRRTVGQFEATGAWPAD